MPETMKHAALAAILSTGLLASLNAQGYVPHRVFDTATRQFTDFEAMTAALSRADVVFVGEQHDDPNTHRLERHLLEALAARRDGVVLSLEMFERDVQSALDQFRAGTLAEELFLKDARPWPRYATDYKPLVDFALSRQWPVVAANIPRPIASEIAKGGVGILDAKPEGERPWFAAEHDCPTTNDEYFDRFSEVMGGHAGAEEVLKYYESQCLKDETMAESIAAAWRAAAGTPGPTRPLVVHYNGAFHSDFGLGTASRTQRRLPDQQMVVVTMMPLGDIQALETVVPEGDDLRRARFLVYTVGK
jgi:uncharacterized iron-regulated protein